MARSKSPKKKVSGTSIATAAFVDSLGARTGARAVDCFVGYVGKASKSGQVRLYFRPQLDWYVEIPTAAVRHSETFQTAGIGGGPPSTWMWVDRKAKKRQVLPPDIAAQAAFLRGAVAAGALGGTGTSFSSLLPAYLSTVPCVTVICVTVIICIPVIYTILYCSCFCDTVLTCPVPPAEPDEPDEPGPNA